MTIPRVPAPALRRACSCAFAATILGLAAQAQVRLRQVYAGGGETGALYTNDFVELYNSGAPQSLAGWSLQTASAGGGAWAVTALPSVVLGSERSFLIRLGAGGTLPPGQSMALPTADATGLTFLSSSDGKLALVSSTTALSGATPASPDLVDFVGYGPGASWNEPGAPFDAANNAPSPSADASLVRADCASFDSDDNHADWAVQTPSPRNSQLAAIVGMNAAGLCAPHIAEVGQAVRVDVEATTCAGDRSSALASYTLDAAPIGGSGALALNDSGVAGDLQAGDGVWSALVSVAPGTPTGTAQLRATIVDGAASTALFVALEIRSTNAPDNDHCFSAQALGALPAGASGTFAVGSAEHNPILSASATTPPGSMGARRGQWFSVLGTGATMTAQTCNSPLNGASIPDTVLMVLSGSCDALSVVAYNDDAPASCGVGAGIERRSLASWCSVAGQTYWIWVAPFATGAQSFAYALDVTDDGVPCSGGLVATSCAPLSGGSFEPEGSFGPARDDGCDSSAGRFVDAAPAFPAQRWIGAARQYSNLRDTDWYRFQAASSTTLTATLTAQFHGSLELWQLSPTGDCTGSALLASAAVGARCASTSTSIALVAGEWYAARVAPQNTFNGAAFGGFAPGGDGVGYALDLALPSGVANDDCSGAMPLACPSTTAGATVGAAPDLSTPACSGPGAQDLSSTAPGVWYSITLPGIAGVDDRVVYAEVSSADYDAKLSVFVGACGALTCVTANNDSNLAALPRVAWVATAGETYGVLVHGAGAGSGTFVLDLACELPVANDDCALAMPIGGESGSIGGDFAGSTGLASTAYTDVATCGAPYAFFDVWYELTLDCDTTLSLDTCGAVDTLLSVHGACPTPFDAFEISGACNDDGSCAPGSELSAPFVAGVYLVRIASTQPSGAFTLTWTVADFDGDGVADCSDGCPNDPLKLAPGACGCGQLDTDGDGDGEADCTDGCPLDPLKVAPGACGCGVLDIDSDGDGVADCVDLCPADPFKSAPGVCGCGAPDTDTDGDGTPDCVDGCPNDPLKLAAGVCGCGTPDVDSDGDGTLDCNDGCPLDPLKLAPGVCGCGSPDVDSDGDGALDCNDGCPLDPLKLAPGVCGCGAPDVDGDGDGTPDCNDGCPSDPLKTAPGACGCGVSEFDADGDGVADCIDNCPSLANPTQDDCDFDGAGDACELLAGTALDVNGNLIPDNCELGVVFNYCTAGASSNGCVATMTSSGTFSVSASSGFVVAAVSVEGQKQGILFYGLTGPVAQPWGPSSTSFKCVKGPVQRMGAGNSLGTNGACDGALSEDVLLYLSTHAGALGMPVSAGQVFSFQTWYRDPPAPGTTNLSDALQATSIP